MDPLTYVSDIVLTRLRDYTRAPRPAARVESRNLVKRYPRHKLDKCSNAAEKTGLIASRLAAAKAHMDTERNATTSSVVV